jgi:hypothetical protein
MQSSIYMELNVWILKALKLTQHSPQCARQISYHKLCKNLYCRPSEISDHIFQFDTKRDPLKFLQVSLIEKMFNGNMYEDTDTCCAHWLWNSLTSSTHFPHPAVCDILTCNFTSFFYINLIHIDTVHVPLHSYSIPISSLFSTTALILYKCLFTHKCCTH